MHPIDSLKNANGEIERENIKKAIPYEDPFLMIDKITSLDKSKVIAIKNIKPEESYFKGHFVGFPIMPGVLIVEGIGQAATLLVRYNLENHQNYDILAYKVKDAVFKLPSFPGDQLRYEIQLIAMDIKTAVLQCRAFKGNDLVAELGMMLAFVDKEKFRDKFKQV